MMIAEDLTRRASTLVDVLQQIEDAFREAGEPVVFQYGAQHLDHFGVGSGTDRKVLMVPEAPGGAMDRPLETGNAASQRHRCDVYVRAPAGSSSLERFKLLYELNDKLIGAIIAATTGRCEWGAVSDESPLKTDTSGCALGYSFTYQRDIPNWEALRGKTYTGQTTPKSDAVSAPVRISVNTNPSE